MGKSSFCLCVVSLLLCISLLMPCACAAEGMIIVSLGDSYSSGESIEPFYGQDADFPVRCQNPDWIAHRSEKSWPGRLTLPGVNGVMNEHRGENWFFAAASGAETKHLFLLTEEEILAGKSAQHERKYDRDGISGSFFLPPQLEIFDELDAEGLKADYVTVTIGGNDLGFQMIVKLSLLGMLNLLPGDTPAEEAEALWDFLYVSADVRTKIKRVYTDIAARAGEQACILAVGYPRLLAPDCGLLFPGESPEILNLAVAFFNAEFQSIVGECRREGINIRYVSVEEAFTGHEAYSDDPGINRVIFGSQEQDLDAHMLGSYYSMHPNETGAEIYARCVQEAINRIESDKKR